MIKKILAVVAAAVCAGAIVGFIPQPAPAVAAGTPHAVQSQTTSIPDSNTTAVATADGQMTDRGQSTESPMTVGRPPTVGSASSSNVTNVNRASSGTLHTHARAQCFYAECLQFKEHTPTKITQRALMSSCQNYLTHTDLQQCFYTESPLQFKHHTHTHRSHSGPFYLTSSCCIISSSSSFFII